MVGESSDPVPGDPEQVAKLGRELRTTAEAIQKQAKEIEALASVENWKSKTAEAFREQADGAGEKLRKAFDRYDEASDALGTSVKMDCGSEYVSELDRAQRMADNALVDAEEAEADRTSAQKSLDAQPADTPDDDPDKEKFSGRVESAEGRLNSAKNAIESARSIRDEAAKAAADKIREVIENDGLEDGWTDKFKNWVKENSDWLKVISKWAGRIAAWAGAAALVVGWIPVIGQALAAVAGVIALTAGVVALATDLVLALGGEGSWRTVVLDAIGVATFGLGRAAMAGAKGANAAAKAVARSNLYKAARAAGRNQKNAWKIANRGSQGSIRGKNAAQAMANMPKGKLPGWGAVKEGFSPRALYRDTVDGVKTVRNGMSEFRFPSGPTKLDPDLARGADDLGRISPDAKGLPEVRDAVGAFNGNAAVWSGSTAAGTVAGFEGAYGSVTDAYNTVTGR